MFNVFPLEFAPSQNAPAGEAVLLKVGPDGCVSVCIFSLLFGYSPAELGDCDPLEHTLDLVTEFRFVPDQTEDVELAIFNAWRECRCAFHCEYMTANLMLIHMNIH